jgi:hypothetical protein
MSPNWHEFTGNELLSLGAEHEIDKLFYLTWRVDL